MENDHLKDRIKAIMDSKHMNNKVFATETGINEGTLSLLLRGKTQPTLKHYEAIHTRFPDITMEWLFDGKGSMYPSGEEQSAAVHESLSEVSQATSFPSSSTLSLFDTNRSQSIDKAGYNEKIAVKIVDKPQRRITEIRVFFDDQTWESFVPKK